MSYKLGQFRRPQISSYSTQLTAAIGKQATDASTGGDVVFYNACGNLTGRNVVNSQNCYYLRFGVRQRNDDQQVFYLKLHNVTETEDNEQLIEQYKVSRGTGTVYFEIVLAPNATYNQILFELQRTALDYRMVNVDGTYGRTMNVVFDRFERFVDVVAWLKTQYPGLEYLTKIGVQGPPSLLMCINKEQIRIGKSGIYQLNNNINVTSISFMPQKSTLSEDGLDYFIMDFEY